MHLLCKMNSLNQQNVNVSIGLNQNYLHRFHTHPNKASIIILNHILCANYTSTHNIDLNQCFLVLNLKKTFGPNFEIFKVFCVISNSIWRMVLCISKTFAISIILKQN